MNFIKVHKIEGRLLKEESSLARQGWEISKKVKFTLCSCSTCINRAEVGVEVEEVSNERRGTSYIIPLCEECNSNLDNYYVNINDLVVSSRA
ncbi:hypothetical protein ACQPU1_09925 [Clostridium paraputrificum]|uniref:hypothetical protein n=1 Tax=Clostridium paraputrificum TaxID=29363 RepID=UPI003D348309